MLHFIRSPEAELARQADQAKLETLQAENEALRSQLSHGIEMSDESQSENVAAAMAKAHVVGLERKVILLSPAARLHNAEALNLQLC